MGGLLPLLALPLLIRAMPESLRWLVARRPARHHARSARIIQQLAPDLANGQVCFSVDEAPATVSSPIGQILSKGFFTGTLLLWLTYFMGLFLVYLLGSWLPTLIKDNGMSVTTRPRVLAGWPGRWCSRCTSSACGAWRRCCRRGCKALPMCSAAGC